MLEEFWDKEQEESAEDLPIGGSFLPGSLIARWSAARLWRVGWTEYDLDEYPDDIYPLLAEAGVESGQKYYLEKARSSTDKYRYIFQTRQIAQVITDFIESQFKPEHIWHIQCKIDDVLNFTSDEMREGYSKNGERDVIFFRLPIKDWNSPQRHWTHLVSLPAMVVAMANGFSYENAGFDLSALTDPEAIFTEEFQDHMLGPRYDRTIGSNTFDDFRYQEGRLFGQRSELWSSLGEKNPKAFNMPNRKPLTVKSEKLIKCLSPFWYGFRDVYARVQQVPSPMLFDLSQSGNRLNIPVFTEFFTSEAEARKAAVAEMEAAGQEASEPLPEVPEVYQNDKELWVELVRGMRGKEITKENVVATHGPMAMTGVTVEDYQSWAKVV